ncbi:MAG TPA: hypothetical protein VFD58_18785 [Blastocatellia bacterium]|nr:hypothetical protein [Blastocatellia bacterium]
MKKFILFGTLLACLCALAAVGSGFAQEKKEGDHKFKIEEVVKFHELLHPIWYEQYPKKEWAKIRSQADELVSRKEAIMKVRLRTKAENRAAIEERRQKFGASVDALAKAAKSGSEEELARAVEEMHKRFEEFAEAIA